VIDPFTIEELMRKACPVKCQCNLHLHSHNFTMEWVFDDVQKRRCHYHVAIHRVEVVKSIGPENLIAFHCDKAKAHIRECIAHGTDEALR
jgi:hypothetical protein